ncbi:MAG: DUF7527 domain-containing protein [Halohasta sp.]
MDSEIVDAVTGWESTSFSGGYDGLHGLADREFSGAVTQGTVWAFMLNGRLIGVEDGSVEAFADADGTAYEAPDQALPLLYAMRGRGEQQAQYYTNKKSISEADATLSSGNFTGYIELSENVLSGDYYTVYYGGKSMSVAFVGNSRKLLTDEEAFERADDEVGIYTVYAADLEVIEIPEPAAGGSEDAPEPSTDSSDGSTDSTGASTDTADKPVGDSVDDSADGSTDESASGSSTRDGQGSVRSVTPTPKARPGSDTSSGRTATRSRSETSSTNGDGGAPTASAARSAGTATGSTDQRADDDVFSDEAQWRNAKTIPSLDPSGDDDRETATSAGSRSAVKARPRGAESSSSLSRKQLKKRLARAEQVMEAAEEKHETLREERDAAIAERDAAREELEGVRQQLSEAEAEVERLRERLESGGGTDQQPTGSRSMSTTEALQGTNLLVRYASKGETTLEDVISGAASQAELRENIRIEPHTTFDGAQVSVDGTPFETFLEGRIELAFVRWLAEEFIFDIQQTGNQTDLNGIYEAIPAINRAELRGTVSLGTDEEGDPIETTFDLVVRDKRDEPLFVADFNESNQPVGGGMVDSLVRDGSEIIERNESFAAAFAVTTSYYKGEALDAAADATGGSLLSASRGKSFVYISRKRGFHLCLVERLGDTFDLHVPEL